MRNTKREIYTPVMFPHLFKSDADWEYYTEPQAELNDRRLYQPRGKTLGGSSSTNAQIYNRGIGGTSTTGPHWGTKVGHPEELLELFKQSEEFRGTGDDEFHGTDGPLTVSDLVDPHPSSEMFIEAAESCGLDRNQDINGETQLGADCTTSPSEMGSAVAVPLRTSNRCSIARTSRSRHGRMSPRSASTATALWESPTSRTVSNTRPTSPVK